ncbi:phosphatidylserine/phosphatidylglycerophosphate/cardiolipin synthase family protein, partial [Mesorhizobium sp. M4B.F.Ca.ET.143.01.1.1]
APKTFSFSGLQARSVQIVLRQAGQQPVDIGGSCDGPLAIRASGRSTTVARASPFHLSLPVADTSSVSLFPDETLSRCDLRISSSQAPAGAPLTLLREEAADPWIAGLDSRYDRCPVPDPAGLEELDRVFYA